MHIVADRDIEMQAKYVTLSAQHWGVASIQWQ